MSPVLFRSRVVPLLCLALLAQDASAAAVPGRSSTAVEKPEELTLSIAIAKAMRNNPDIADRRLQEELNELTFDDAWYKMWMPTVSLQLTNTANYTLFALPGSAAAFDAAGNREHGNPFTPSGKLVIGEYNLYNFGKDKDAYDKAKLDVERARDQFHEVERRVRFDVIKGVFKLKTKQDLLEVAQRSVDSAHAIHELVKSRVPLGKATENDLSSTAVDLLTAENALIQTQTEYNQALWELNVVLGDPIDHPYSVRGTIRYIKFRMSLDDVVKVFKDNSPAIKDKRRDLNKAHLDLRLAEKGALPLPTISFSGVTIGNTYGQRGGTLDRETSPGTPSGNFDISAAINFSIPIMGDGGFLSGRALRRAEIAVEQSELALRRAGNEGERDVRGLYTQILQTESMIENNERLFKESLKVFEGVLAALQSRSSLNRLDLKDALRQLRESETSFTQSVLDHYNNKLELANSIGVDRFPEENL